MRGALSLVLALAVAGCSTSGASSGGSADAASEDASTLCGPAPESIAVSGDDCVAASPNPCCAGFTLFSCTGADAGSTCSETTSCVRAARYDQSVCNGGLAYSCPELNSGGAYATMTTPGCAQADMEPQNGEGIRWCCGGSGITIPVPDASTGDGAAVTVDSGTVDSSTVDSGTPPIDSGSDTGGGGVMDAAGD